MDSDASILQKMKMLSSGQAGVIKSFRDYKSSTSMLIPCYEQLPHVSVLERWRCSAWL